jgi:hypothetical protein
MPFYMYIPVFVMNRIPSDLYRKRNPKLEILKNEEQGYWFVSNQEKEFQAPVFFKKK